MHIAINQFETKINLLPFIFSILLFKLNLCTSFARFESGVDNADRLEFARLVSLCLDSLESPYIDLTKDEKQKLMTLLQNNDEIPSLTNDEIKSMPVYSQRVIRAYLYYFQEEYSLMGRLNDFLYLPPSLNFTGCSDIQEMEKEISFLSEKGTKLRLEYCAALENELSNINDVEIDSLSWANILVSLVETKDWLTRQIGIDSVTPEQVLQVLSVNSTIAELVESGGVVGSTDPSSNDNQKKERSLIVIKSNLNLLSLGLIEIWPEIFSGTISDRINLLGEQLKNSDNANLNHENSHSSKFDFIISLKLLQESLIKTYKLSLQSPISLTLTDYRIQLNSELNESLSKSVLPKSNDGSVTGIINEVRQLVSEPRIAKAPEVREAFSQFNNTLENMVADQLSGKE